MGFGKDIGAECDTIVTTYAPELISYIVMNEDPQTACTAVGLCSSAKASPRSSRTRPASSNQAPTPPSIRFIFVVFVPCVCLRGPSVCVLLSPCLPQASERLVF